MSAVLAGPRVRLRPPEPGDREARAALGRHPEIVRGFGGADPERRELLPEALDAWWGRLTSAEHAWVIEYEGSFAGEIRLDDVDEREGTARLSVGLFDPELLGQGLGSESVYLVLRYAFLEMRLERVSLVVLADNERAIRCYRTCGFVEEGRLRGSAVVEGERRDELAMAILRDEFLGRFGRDDRPDGAQGDWVEQRLAWLRTLPRKRMGAAALIRDRAGRVLIAEPTYRSGWTVPGGMVEDGEGPWEACRREVLEELGHDIELGDLLRLHYQRHREGADESVMLVFDGGSHDDDWFEGIELRETELRSWKLVAPEQMDDYLSPRLARRFRSAIEALDGGPTYLGPEGDTGA